MADSPMKGRTSLFSVELILGSLQLFILFILFLGNYPKVSDLRPQVPLYFDDGFQFDRPYQEVFREAEETLKELELTVYERNPDKQYIIAERASGWLDLGWGKMIGVYFISDGPRATRVLVLNQKRWGRGVTTADRTHDIYLGLSLRLR